MKKIFLFCTKLRVYWVELPLIALLSVCIHYNQFSDGLMKLYPLIITLILGMVFILLYFFRVIKISFDEIRYIGLFTSRDSSVITEGKTLIIKELRRGRLEITLFGNDGVLPELDWLKSTGEAPRDISLFRGVTIGGKRTVRRILTFFGVPKEDTDKLLLSESFSGKYPIADITSESADGKKTVKLTVTKTV